MDAARRSGSGKALLVATTVAAVALLAMAPAFACGPTSTAHITPQGGAPGIGASVTGTLFKPSMGEVVVKWGGAGGVLLATAAVDAEGSFGPVPVTIPADAEPGLLAILAVYQPGDPSARVSNVTFQVSGTPVTAAPAPPAAVESSPATGAAPAAAPVPAPAAAAHPAPAAAPVGARRAAPAAVPAAATAAIPAAAVPLPTAPAAEAPAPSPAPPALDLPEITETDPAGVRADTPARPVDRPVAARDPGRDGPSAWVLVPLLALGFTLLAVGTAVLYEPRRRRETVRSRLGGRRCR